MRREGEEEESGEDEEECPRRREGSLAQGMEEISATATNVREDSDPPMGLLKDHSLGASLRKFGSLPLSRLLQKILLFACSQRRLLGAVPDNEAWDTYKRSKRGQKSPAIMRAVYLQVG